MSETTDIKSTLTYGTNNEIRPYFYAYQRSEEERKTSHNKNDFGGETAITEVTGMHSRVLNTSVALLFFFGSFSFIHALIQNYLFLFLL